MHRFLSGCDVNACAGVRNGSRTNVGVKIDPRTCLTLLFLGPVSKVKET